MDGSRSTAADAPDAASSAADPPGAALAEAGGRPDPPPSAHLACWWRASPVRVRPRRCALGAAAILALAALVGVVAQDALWGALTALALVVCTLDAWVPAQYVANAEGLRMHGALRSRHVRWEDVRGVAFERDGAFLTTARGGVTVHLDAPERGAWLRQQVEHARVDGHPARIAPAQPLARTEAPAP
jgi:hypothetical protein